EYLARCGVYNITSRCAWAYLWKKGAKSHAEILESQASLS
ncbi:glycerophosphodiester phosphodiesterase, partial [Enterococcus faecium]